eukprot:g5061.t1
MNSAPLNTRLDLEQEARHANALKPAAVLAEQASKLEPGLEAHHGNASYSAPVALHHLSQALTSMLRIDGDAAADLEAAMKAADLEAQQVGHQHVVREKRPRAPRRGSRLRMARRTTEDVVRGQSGRARRRDSFAQRPLGDQVAQLQRRNMSMGALRDLGGVSLKNKNKDKSKKRSSVDSHGRRRSSVASKTNRYAFGMARSHPLRALLLRAAQHPFFDRGVILLILANCASMAATDPTAAPCDTLSKQLETLEMVFLFCFTVELAIKMVAFGPGGEHGYFADRWNWLDALVVVSGWIAFLVALAQGGFLNCEQESNSVFNALRVVRILRPLRAIRGFPALRQIIEVLILSFPALVDVLLMCCLIFFIFGILGLQLFQGKLQQACYNGTASAWVLTDPADELSLMHCSKAGRGGGRSCPPGCQCLDSGVNPNMGITNFDNIGSSLLTIFQVMTLEGWTPIMYAVRDSAGSISDAYFILVVLIGSLFVVNVIVAVIYNSFVTMQGDADTHVGIVQNIEMATAKIVRAGAEYRKKKIQADCNRMRGRVVELYDMGRAAKLGLKKDDVEAWRQQYHAYALEHADSSSSGGDSELDSDSSDADDSGDDAKLKLKATRSLSAYVIVAGFVGLMLGKTASREFWPGPSAPWVRRKALHIGLSWYFHAATVAVIVLNTLALTSENYYDSDGKKDVLDALNYTFTSFFAFEMVVKLVAFTPRGYVAEGVNLFDAFIVLVGLTEIIVGVGAPGSSGLRAFRLLRIFKLAQHWESLNRTLQCMWRTVSSVLPFTAILLLVMFSFSLLGMQMFGGKFAYEFDSRPCNATLRALVEPNCTINATEGRKFASQLPSGCYPPRTNYDSFGWAFVTTFSVLTGEDWNAALYLAMDSAGHVGGMLYFVILICLGTYLVLNLVVAILIDKFVEAHKAQVLKEKPRAGATPGGDTRDSAGANGGEIAATAPDGASGAAVAATTAPEMTHRSLFLFSPTNPARVWLRRLVTSRPFNVAIAALIMASCVTITIDAPGRAGKGPSDATKSILDILDAAFTSIFTAECVLKLVVQGGFLHEGAYFRDRWNVLDFVIVVTSLVSVLDEGSGGASTAKAFRALRAFRPLRMIRRVPGLRVAIDAMGKALPACFEVAVICVLFFLVFGILGFNFLQGRLGYCRNDCTRTCDASQPWCTNATAENLPCVGMSVVPEFTDKTRVWTNMPPGGAGSSGAPMSFDSALLSTAAFFEIATLEGWIEVMWRVVDSTGKGRIGQRNASPEYVILFFAFIVVNSFFLLNLFVSVVIDRFNNARKSSDGYTFVTPQQRAWQELQSSVNLLHQIESHMQLKKPPGWLRGKAFDLVVQPFFQNVVMWTICVNVLVMGCTYYGQSEDYTLALDVVNYVFLAVFGCEAALKILGMGPRAYFRMGWNRFDFGLFVVDFILTVIEVLYSEGIGFDVSILRLARLGRMFRLIRAHQGLYRLMKTLFYSMPALLNVGTVLLLIIFVFACLGMNLFGGICYANGEFTCSHITRDANFDTMADSITLLFRAMTGEAWNAVMRDCLAEAGSIAVVYFYVYVILCQFVLLNLFVAAVLENFESAGHGNASMIVSVKPALWFARDRFTSWRRSVF